METDARAVFQQISDKTDFIQKELEILENIMIHSS